MSVEQTSQLIQLILNSVVMVTACVIISSGLMMRHIAIVNRLRAAQRSYAELLGKGDTSGGTYGITTYGIASGGFQEESYRENRIAQLKTQLRQLRRQYRTVHYSIVTAHYALLFCGASTLAIAFRTLIGSNWLINTALVLFVIGVGILLISVGMTLWDFHTTDRSLRHEINGVLVSGAARTSASKAAVSQTGTSQTGSEPASAKAKHRRGSRKLPPKVG